jgi:hypothetical protein
MSNSYTFYVIIRFIYFQYFLKANKKCYLDKINPLNLPMINIINFLWIS